MLSIAICTHNRADDVAECLSALKPQTAGNGTEIYIIDSASSADSALKLKALARDFDVKYFRLDEPGLSLARNAACTQATGDWIAYLDDDAIPMADWLSSLLNVLERTDADVGVVGGKIVPKWPSGRDGRGITARWRLLLSCTEAAGSGRVTAGYNICGANLAVRTSAIESVDGFPTSLGRIGSKLLSGEEAYLIERLADNGIWAMYDSSFAVHHKIDQSRMTIGWAKDRAFWEGVSRVRLTRLLGHPLPAALNPFKLAASAALLTIMNLISPNADRSIRSARALGSLRAQFGSQYA